jgi:Predicted hydrolases or acyltransferases (alpha/beta hydrolase superfamily)
MNTRTVSVEDGRALEVAEYGPAHGYPVLYMHGAPSSGREWSVIGDDGLLEDLGLRLIAPTRPGMGASDFAPGRTISGIKSDVDAIRAAFAIDQFALLGYSGGCAYAVAAATALTDQVSALALVAPVIHADAAMTAGLDPSGLKMKELVRKHPLIGRFLLYLAMGLPARSAPDTLKKQILKALPPSDVEALSEQGRLDAFVSLLRDAFAAGARGPRLDMALMTSPWDFEMRKLDLPVAIFQGEEDTFGARPAMAYYLAQRLGTDDLQILADGHISIATRHMRQILTRLVPR